MAFKEQGTFQRSPFKFRAAAKSRRFYDGIIPLGPPLGVWTYADLTFANQTFADGDFLNILL